jgi:hypothetical protein
MTSGDSCVCRLPHDADRSSSSVQAKKGGELYSVIFDGKLIVERRRDPECDAARALLAVGITGKLTMLDGKTGRPRSIIDIELAARLTVEE